MTLDSAPLTATPRAGTSGECASRREPLKARGRNRRRRSCVVAGSGSAYHVEYERFAPRGATQAVECEVLRSWCSCSCNEPGLHQSLWRGLRGTATARGNSTAPGRRDVDLSCDRVAQHASRPTTVLAPKPSRAASAEPTPAGLQQPAPKRPGRATGERLCRQRGRLTPRNTGSSARPLLTPTKARRHARARDGRRPDQGARRRA
jgi:hypothetical protein